LFALQIKIVRHGKTFMPATSESTKDEAHAWDYAKLCFRGSLQARLWLWLWLWLWLMAPSDDESLL
jgi:hypothetical protein